MDRRRRPDARALPATSAPPATATLWTVQVMRGLAALMVVVGHSQSAIATLGGAAAAFVRSTLVPWGAGVDLFFVISGFIMIHASARLFGRPDARRDFLRRRLVRIVPLYWLVTAAYLVLLAAASLKGGDRFPRGGAILASFAFFPADTWGNGRLFPVFDLGWTLNYEMFFYAVLALVVRWPRRRAIAAAAGLLALLVAVGTAVSPGTATWFWTRPILLDFGLGLAVGALVGNGIKLTPRWRIGMAIVAGGALLADPFHVFDGPAGFTVANAWPRVLAAGVPIAALLGAAVLGPEPAMPRLARPLTRIGDASYSLYLFHPFALIATEKLAQKAPAVRAQPWLLVAVTVAMAIVVALAAYRWMERPLTTAVTRAVAPRRPARRPIET